MVLLPKVLVEGGVAGAAQQFAEGVLITIGGCEVLPVLLTEFADGDARAFLEVDAGV